METVALGAIDLYEVIVAAAGIAALVGVPITVTNFRTRYVRQERDELDRQVQELREQVRELRARPDMTAIAELVKNHDERAAVWQRETLDVLKRIARAFDIRVNGGS